MTTLPFLCLGIGFVAGLQKTLERFVPMTDQIINWTLVVLMLTIGLNMGVNPSIMLKLSSIGFNCLIIALSAIFFSVVMTVLVEKTVLPLDRIREKVCLEKSEETESKSSLVWIMPVSIAAGVLLGYYAMPSEWVWVLEYSLMGALVLLYVGVGISLGVNRHVFKYMKVLGFRVLYLPLAIFIGSLLGGALAGELLNLPTETGLVSASGMSYYSLTGAYMTKVYGIETGTYGFVVNVMREFLTVLLLPLLIKISKGSPIAGGAAGNMDTMLMPVTKFVGPELGLVTLLTGTLLTFAVPFVLPLLYNLLR